MSERRLPFLRTSLAVLPIIYFYVISRWACGSVTLNTGCLKCARGNFTKAASPCRWSGRVTVRRLVHPLLARGPCPSAGLGLAKILRSTFSVWDTARVSRAPTATPDAVKIELSL